MKTILVTGANGFIGKALYRRLVEEGLAVRAVGRSAVPGCTSIGPIDADTDWSAALDGVDSIVHLAARVHVMRDREADPLAAFRKVNVEGTAKLASEAARRGVRRFVFVSSIKVNGESTRDGTPFQADDPPAPTDPYGLSKYEAEQVLLRLAGETEMEVVVIRPPLVYGPGVKANFEAMIRWLMRGVPLPLGAIRNRRTLVALDNLVDLIITCVRHPRAANEVFLAGDAEHLSTPELLRRLGRALEVQPTLISVPVWLVEVAAAAVGKRAVARRLCGNLEIDISKARRLLDWSPPVTVDEGLRRVASHYLQRQS